MDSQYALAVGDGSTEEDVKQRCHEHHVLIIGQFLKEEKAFDWKQTDFFAWMMTSHKVSVATSSSTSPPL
jgi:hypothetical protein